MRLFDVNGRLVSKPIGKYLIDWNGKSRSIIQFKVKKFLEPYWRPYLIYEEFPVFGSLLKVDILNLSQKIAIEVNGKQHESYNSFFHRGCSANYLRSIKNDHKKMLWLEKNGFYLVEIMEDEVPNLSRDFFMQKFNIKL